jgi:hypothetical protein
MTEYEDIIDILGELVSFHKQDERFKHFIQSNDLGFPLAYLSREGLCEIIDDGERYVLETWGLFIKFLGIEDTGFNDLSEVLDASGSKNA